MHIKHLKGTKEFPYRIQWAGDKLTNEQVNEFKTKWDISKAQKPPMFKIRRINPFKRIIGHIRVKLWMKKHILLNWLKSMNNGN